MVILHSFGVIFLRKAVNKVDQTHTVLLLLKYYTITLAIIHCKNKNTGFHRIHSYGPNTSPLR